MSARLSGRLDIVTAAGRGLGRGMAFWLARLGATVIGPANIASDFDNLKPADALPGALLALMTTCGDPPTAMRSSGLRRAPAACTCSSTMPASP
jgi:NAD(P)-dependent dehydrogenase (short-subunit alcohol dehydrogenase family)